MVGQHHEAAVEQPLLAGEDRLYNCLEVVIHHALRHAAEEGEGAVVRVEHHLLGLSRVGHDEHLAAERQPEMRNLDGLHDASELDMFVAPVELADLTGSKRQRNVGLRQGRAGFGGLPPLHEPLHAVVGTAIPLGLQSLEQPPRGAPLGFGQQALGSQPGLQRRPGTLPASASAAFAVDRPVQTGSGNACEPSDETVSGHARSN